MSLLSRIRVSFETSSLLVSLDFTIALFFSVSAASRKESKHNSNKNNNKNVAQKIFVYKLKVGCNLGWHSSF